MVTKIKFIFLTSIILIQAQEFKFVGIVPARNEAQAMPSFLQALSMFTDAIIILDDASEDNTLEVVKSLAKKYNVEKIISKKQWFRDEPGDKNKLLEAGREIGGTHFILIDVDEMLTSNLLENNFLRRQVSELKPGDKLCLKWINLWFSTNYYRFDISPWGGPAKGDFIFCDDKKCFYESKFIHTPRSPSNLSGSVFQLIRYNQEHIEPYKDLIKEDFDVGLMHFQFLNWNNLLIKQAWYRCLEKIRNPNVEIDQINQMYGETKAYKEIQVSKCPKRWFSSYPFFDKNLFFKIESWQKKAILNWFEQYGKNFFKDLDIWDIDWELND